MATATVTSKREVNRDDNKTTRKKSVNDFTYDLLCRL